MHGFIQYDLSNQSNVELQLSHRWTKLSGIGFLAVHVAEGQSCILQVHSLSKQTGVSTAHASGSDMAIFY